MIRNIAAFLALTLTSFGAFGHPGHEQVSGFASGFAHPLAGVDHLLAMVALGIWAAQWQGRSMLVAPAIFVGGMLVGTLFALAGGNFPFVEHGIALSVLIIGLLLAAVPAKSMAAKLALPLIALGAAFHGYAHGTELPHATEPAPYLAGFVTATALLHAFGMVIGLQLKSRSALRAALGAAIAITGSTLALML